MKKIIQVLIIAILFIFPALPALAEEGVVSSYSESVAEGSGNIQAIAEAVVSSFGAFASSTITVTSNGGYVVAIAFAQISNYGHSTLGITIGGTEGGTDATIDTSADVQTINGNKAQVDVTATGSELTVVAIASANDQHQQVLQLQPIPVTNPFFGYTFGKCDVERYVHFALQLKDNITSIDDIAKYNMDILANRNSKNEIEFIEHYVKPEYIRFRAEGNGNTTNRNVSLCTLPRQT